MISTLRKYIPKPVRVRARGFQRQISSLGAKYRCSVCGSRVNYFDPLPAFYTDNLEKYGFRFTADDAETCNNEGYSCPACVASDRDRLYALYIRNYLTRVESDGVIEMVDFAPSTPLSHFIRKQTARSGQAVSYRTADMFMEGADDKIDITDMRAYSDNQFDVFICSHVLEHVTDDKKALRELYRILKPKGQGILMVPIVLSLEQIDEDPSIVDEGERWRRFGQFDHVRLYSKAGFVERVEESGFLLHQLGREYFGERLLARTGITNRSVLYVVEK